MTFVRFRGSVFEVLSHFKILPNFSKGLRTFFNFMSMNPMLKVFNTRRNVPSVSLFSHYGACF